MTRERAIVIGAGVGGLVCALQLAAAGMAVTVVERQPGSGGKLRGLAVGDKRIDAGPTVFTMRWVFDEIFDAAGTSLEAELKLYKLDVLARHAWTDDARLDLFADTTRTADAIGVFAGAAEAQRFLAFSSRARQIYATLERPFLRAPRGGPIDLMRRSGARALPDLLRIAPFSSMWGALGQHFHDGRLRQLFGRYATYCGSSPFLAPATLMLIAHVEQDGVWTIEGGMHRLADALQRMATVYGAEFRFNANVVDIEVTGSRARGVTLDTGERLAAEAVVVNADVAALGLGLLGNASARAVAPADPKARSLSAITWAIAARTSGGFPLVRHNVFFSDDYAAEFEDLFERSAVPRAPTVYVCAQDRDEHQTVVPDRERLLCLINAPPVGDHHAFRRAEIEECEERTFTTLQRRGLTIERQSSHTVVTTPTDFAALYPGTGGALYGRASHGWRASFQRPGSRTRIPRLYLAGGSTHPGPGVPMAALSGRTTAASILEDLSSTRR